MVLKVLPAATQWEPWNARMSLLVKSLYFNKMIVGAGEGIMLKSQRVEMLRRVNYI